MIQRHDERQDDTENVHIVHAANEVNNCRLNNTLLKLLNYSLVCTFIKSCSTASPRMRKLWTVMSCASGKFKRKTFSTCCW